MDYAAPKIESRAEVKGLMKGRGGHHGGGYR